MNTDKDKLKVIINKIDTLEKKVNGLEQLLLDELDEDDLYNPYPSYNSANSLDILINTTALIIE